MKLAIVNITGGRLSGGYLKYLQNMIPLLEKRSETEKLLVTLPEGEIIPANSTELSYWKKEHTVSVRKQIHQALNRFKPDLIFIPTARRFRFGSTPVVNMVRNMEPLEVPFGMNPLTEKLKNILRAREAKRSTFEAARTIAVSHHVKEFILSNWNRESEKVGVVYHGLSTESSQVESHHVPSAVSLRMGDKAEPFLFTAGSIRPARGTEDLIAALPAISEQFPEYSMVIAGTADPGMSRYHRHLLHLAETLGVAQKIIWTGKLTENEMTWCYQNCSAFIMTSRAEACPNTVLEALQYGVLSVSTDRAPMPEFFKEHADYYRSGDSATLFKAVSMTLTREKKESENRSKAMKRRALDFSWESCASETMHQLTLALKQIHH